jgi:DNA-binding GntR family transcriptional regulator
MAASKTDCVQRRIRADILNGQLQPGAKLAFGELRRRYGCSTGVLREALPRLVGEGLATSEPQLGFRVVSVSVDDLRQLTEARVSIETMVLRKAIKEGDVAWEARLMAAHHVLGSVPVHLEDGTVSPEWLAAHATWHRTLLDACSNTRLLGIASSLRDCAEVYRHGPHHSGGEEDRDVIGEHRQILDATLARNADTAAMLLTEHIERTTEILIQAGNHLSGSGTNGDARRTHHR